MKQIDLAKALCENKKCIGFVWRFSNGRYGYQNDNDLGLCLDDIAGKQRYIKKISFGRGYYAYQIVGGFEDDNTGVGFQTMKALLKETHEHILPLSKHEKMLTKRYWKQF